MKFAFSRTITTSLAVSAALTIAMGTTANGQNKATGQDNGDQPQVTNEVTTASALLQPWTGPYGGVPPWHLVRPHGFCRCL